MSLPPFEYAAERQAAWLRFDCALRDMAFYDFWVQVGIVALYQQISELADDFTMEDVL